MKLVRLLSLCLSLCLTIGLQHCKRSDPAPDPYAFLDGTWRHADGAECDFDAVTKTAKVTKVPTNNTQFNFLVGEDYWRNVLATGTNTWSYDQIVRSSDGKTVDYRKSMMKKKDVNTVSIVTPGISDTELVWVP
jgi:hypothetical protein